MAFATSQAQRRSVVDVETTGFSRHDRVVEVGIVCLDSDGDVADEYVTLVDPDRDVGPTHVHGITASMTRNAPRFDDIAGTVAEILDGSVLVAHNAPFDLRFLAQEYERVGVPVAGVRPVCTMRLGVEVVGCGGKLTDLCAALGIPLHYRHSALHDARATAELLRRISERRVVEAARDAVIVLDGRDALEASPRTVRRERFVALGDEQLPYLARLTRRLPSRPHEYSVETYLRVLDDALVDLALSDEETTRLDEVAEIAGLSAEQRARAHVEYFDELVAAALRDGVVTDEEFEVLARVAVLLEQDPDVLDGRVAAYRPATDDDVPVLAPGIRVCFTGDAGLDETGDALTRERLHEAAAAAGMVPVSSLTKRGCDLLVAADPASRSGKAKRARRWGIPVMSVDEFLDLTAGGDDATPSATGGH